MVLHTRVPEEQVKKARGRFRRRSRAETERKVERRCYHLTAPGPMFLNSPYTCESVRCLSKRPGIQCYLSVSVMTKEDTETTQYLWTVAAVYDYEPMVLLQPCLSDAIFI